MQVFIKVYESNVEVLTTIISGQNMKDIAKCYEAIGLDSKLCLTVSKEEEIEAFADNWAVFFCNKFGPSVEFIQKHSDWLFIDTNDIANTKNEVPNRMHFYSYQQIKELAEFTGISAFRGLVYDKKSNLFVNTGKVFVPQQRNVPEIGKRFSQEMLRWTVAGMPKREQSVVQLLWDTFCSKCSEYIPNKQKLNVGRCNLCGCGIKRDDMGMLNKLVWGTTSCPVNPPKWTAEIAVNEERIKGREQELLQQYLEVQKQEYGLQEGKTCECD